MTGTSRGFNVLARWTPIALGLLGGSIEFETSVLRRRGSSVVFTRGENRALRGGPRADKVIGRMTWHITVGPASPRAGASH